MKKFELGIALGGGGARGFAHLGVLHALAEKGIRADIYSGVSAGAIVGAFVASGMRPIDIFHLMKKKSFFTYSRVQLPIDGLMSLEGLKKHLQKEVKIKNLEELPYPLFVAATNLNDGKIEYFQEGPLDELVPASAAIPALFSPVVYQGKQYVDGGVLDGLPLAPLLPLCEKTIAINIMPIEKTGMLNNLKDIAFRSFMLGVHYNMQNARHQCDLYIEPEDLVKFHFLSTKNADKLFQVGYDYVQQLEVDELFNN